MTNMLRNSLKPLWITVLILTLTGCSLGPAPGVQPVTGFDLARYTGTWYEIARLDHRFERGLADVSATYRVQADGSVEVRNRGFDLAKDEWREAIGRAVFIGAPTTGSLKVSFFGPFYGGYHVVELDPDYRWALVLGPDRDYAWILARDKVLPASVRERLSAAAFAAGIDTSAWVWVTQSRADPALATQR